MKRTRSIVAVAAVIVAVCLATAPICATAAPAPASNSKLTIVLATGVTWSDITPTATPTLWKMAQQGAVADLNSRVRNREPGQVPSPLEGALDLSAGNWATPDHAASPAFNATETVNGVAAATVFRQVTGRGVDGAAICYPGLPAALASNATVADEVVLGTLGQAVRDAGGVTGAVGNSDTDVGGSTAALMRPSVVAAMDSQGLVGAGDVSVGVLRDDPLAPFGRRTDLLAFERGMRDFDTKAVSFAGPRLLVLDPGDAYRARLFSARVTPQVAADQHQAALAELDHVAGLALSDSGPGDSVIVASQALTNDFASGLQGFGPIIVSGPGMSGYLSSASTHRVGVVTNPDVTAEAMSALRLVQPVQVVGSRFGTTPGPAAVSERIGYLSALNSTVVAIDTNRATVADSFIRFFCIVLLLAAALIIFRDRFSATFVSRARLVVVAGALLLFAVPAGCWAMFVFTRTLMTPAEGVVLLAIATAVLWGAAVAVWRWAGARAAAAALCAFTVVLLAVDQLLGAPLSFVNYMGYSPLQSARYYGMGNEEAGLIVGAAIVGVALLLDAMGDGAFVPLVRRIGIPALGALVVLSAAAPFLGANVGVAVWGSAGFIVAWALLNDRPITWKTAIVAVVVIVVLIGAFATIDVLGGGAKTHLARSLASAQQGGPGQLWSIVTRKAQTNARVLGETQWAYILYASLAFLLVMRLRRQPDLADTLAENPSFGAAIVATLVAAVLAFFSEDSGIVVPAFIMLSTGAAIAILMVDRLGRMRTEA